MIAKNLECETGDLSFLIGDITHIRGSTLKESETVLDKNSKAERQDGKEDFIIFVGCFFTLRFSSLITCILLMTQKLVNTMTEVKKARTSWRGNRGRVSVWQAIN